MNENTEITLKVKDLAKFSAVTGSILLEQLGVPVAKHRLEMLHSAVVNDVITNNALENSLKAYDDYIAEKTNP